MIKKIGKFNLFLIGFIFINILQSIYTPLIPDEAYYYMFSQNLSWGYFDHPPMVAYIIKVSSLLFSNELGVRFVTVILNTWMTVIIWKLIPEKNKKLPYAELLFFGILLSMPLFQVYSFITTPDAPLLFSFALYLLAIKKINEKDTITHALFLGLAAALLIYSKYHGGILIILSIVFQPHLLKRWTTYLAGFFALILIFPHLIWLYQNDFIPFKFHIVQRTDGSFKFEHVWVYVVGTIGLLNPALVILFIYFLIKNKTLVQKEDQFLFRMIYGFLFFLFIYSFRARIGEHWVAPALIPLSIIVYNIGITNTKFLKPLKYCVGIVVILIFILRIVPLLDLQIKSPLHTQKKEYYKEIEKLAQDKVVFFRNSFQQTSKYAYYTGKESFSFNGVSSRKNHYDLLSPEILFKGKDVIVVQKWKTKGYDSIVLKNGKIRYYKEFTNYPYYSKLEVKLNFATDTFTNGETKKITFRFKNPYEYDLDFNRKDIPAKLALYFINGENKKSIIINPNINILKAKDSIQFQLDVPIKNIPKGTYNLKTIMKMGIDFQDIGESYSILIE